MGYIFRIQIFAFCNFLQNIFIVEIAYNIIGYAGKPCDIFFTLTDPGQRFVDDIKILNQIK